MLRVEYKGQPYDWFNLDEMGDIVRTGDFANTLRENIAHYFGVPFDCQAVYDEEGVLSSMVDFARALRSVRPWLRVYDVRDMASELKEKTFHQLVEVLAEVERSKKNLQTFDLAGTDTSYAGSRSSSMPPREEAICRSCGNTGVDMFGKPCTCSHGQQEPSPLSLADAVSRANEERSSARPAAPAAGQGGAAGFLHGYTAGQYGSLTSNGAHSPWAGGGRLPGTLGLPGGAPAGAAAGAPGPPGGGGGVGGGGAGSPGRPLSVESTPSAVPMTALVYPAAPPHSGTQQLSAPAAPSGGPAIGAASQPRRLGAAGNGGGAAPPPAAATGVCPHCGNRFMDDANYCRKCGRFREEAHVAPPGPAHPLPAAAPPPLLPQRPALGVQTPPPSFPAPPPAFASTPSSVPAMYTTGLEGLSLQPQMLVGAGPSRRSASGTSTPPLAPLVPVEVEVQARGHAATRAPSPPRQVGPIAHRTPEQLVTPAVAVTEEVSDTVEVLLSKDAAGSEAERRFGFANVPTRDGRALLMSWVDGAGLLARWNRMNPNKAVQEGDRIIRVNNVSENVEAMRAQLQLDIISMLVQRRCSTPY